jgi:hypothetical protein
MAAIFEDTSVFEAFAGREKFDHSNADKVKVEVLDWSKGGETHSQSQISPLLIFQTMINYALTMCPSQNLPRYQSRTYE